MSYIIETSQGRYLKDTKDWRRPNTVTDKNNAKKYTSKKMAELAKAKTKNAYASQWNITELF